MKTQLTGEQAPLFVPDKSVTSASQLTDFIHYCEQQRQYPFADYAEFEAFSIEEFKSFWGLFLAWSGFACEGDSQPVCSNSDCETAEFFPKLKLSFTEVLLADDAKDDPFVITACHHGGWRERIKRSELRQRVDVLADHMIKIGVEPGDRVVVIGRNNPETIISALATARIGAIFASCAPSMGAFAILSRFSPLEPVVLMANIAPQSYDTGDSLVARFCEVARTLPSLRHIVLLDNARSSLDLPVPIHYLADILANGPGREPAEYRRFNFNHPLFVLFSSGTTGAPKCIVHGAGGTLIEHLKEHRLHCDLRAGDKLFFHTTCAWMMWNWQLTALASGAEIVVYDGPLESAETLWRIVESEAVTVFGTSPPYLKLTESSVFSPSSECDLSALRGILSTGSILYPGQYDWVSSFVKNIPIQSISGGTDIVGCFVLGNPNLPVYRDEAQCRSLGMDVESLPPPDDQSNPIGELICANPFPSRPIGFYGDGTGEKFHTAYFSQNNGVWTHGDLIEFTSSAGARMHGRSDGVMNINGIRIGPAEIYQILEELTFVKEALAVEQSSEAEAGGTRIILLVVLSSGLALEETLIKEIRSTIARKGSTHLLPGIVADVSALPKTHSGKISESAARAVVNGITVPNRNALSNPECLEKIAHHPLLKLDVSSDQVNQAASPLSSSSILSRLEEIFQENLRDPSISSKNRLDDMSMDSLQITTILLDIKKHLQITLPIEVLLYANDIEQVSIIIGELSAIDPSEKNCFTPNGNSAQQNQTLVSIRQVQAADVDDIIQLLHEGFDSKHIPKESWRSIFTYSWMKDKPCQGYLAVSDKAIVGFVGIIYAERQVRGMSVVTGNLTSWYVRPEFRASSLSILAAVVGRLDVTYLALTPSPVTVRVLQAMGFQRACSTTVFLPPLSCASTLRNPPQELTFDLPEIERQLSGQQLRIFTDHQPYDCLHALIGDCKRYGYLVVKRRRMRGKIFRALPACLDLYYSEVLYCSDWKLLLQDIERIKLRVMRKQRTIGLAVDAAHLASTSIRGFKSKQEKLYRSTDANWDELDELYSELVLLPL